MRCHFCLKCARGSRTGRTSTPNSSTSCEASRYAETAETPNLNPQPRLFLYSWCGLLVLATRTSKYVLAYMNTSQVLEMDSQTVSTRIAQLFGPENQDLISDFDHFLPTAAGVSESTPRGLAPRGESLGLWGLGGGEEPRAHSLGDRPLTAAAAIASNPRSNFGDTGAGAEGAGRKWRKQAAGEAGAGAGGQAQGRPGYAAIVDGRDSAVKPWRGRGRGRGVGRGAGAGRGAGRGRGRGGGRAGEGGAGERGQQEKTDACRYVNAIRATFAHAPHVYTKFLRVLQSYKDGALTIDVVKAEIAELFRGHPSLLEEFSIFLPNPPGTVQKKARKKYTFKNREAAGGGGGEGEALQAANGRWYKSKKGAGGAPLESEFIPEPGDHAGTIVFEIIELLRARDESGEGGSERYASFIKALALVTHGVLKADDFALLVHDSMMETHALKRWYAPLCKLVGATATLPTYLPSQEMDLNEEDREQVSYYKFAADYIPPVCSGRSPAYAQVLNDEYVSIAQGRDAFLHMRRTQYEIAMFLCEDDRYELDMLIEATLSTIRCFQEQLRVLADIDARYAAGGGRAEGRAGGKSDKREREREREQKKHAELVGDGSMGGSEGKEGGRGHEDGEKDRMAARDLASPDKTGGAGGAGEAAESRAGREGRETSEGGGERARLKISISLGRSGGAGKEGSEGKAARERKAAEVSQVVKQVMQNRHTKILRMLYLEHWTEVADCLTRAPEPTLSIVLPRLQSKVDEWCKTRRDMNKIWAAVYQRNYHKSLDFRSFQFKQADKKALSPQVLAAEAKAVKRLSMRRGQAAPCLRYTMADPAIHHDILQILLHASSASSELVELRVRRIFSRFLHVFLGLHDRDSDEILSSVAENPRAHGPPSPSPSVDSAAAGGGELASPKGGTHKVKREAAQDGGRDDTGGEREHKKMRVAAPGSGEAVAGDLDAAMMDIVQSAQQSALAAVVGAAEKREGSRGSESDVEDAPGTSDDTPAGSSRCGGSDDEAKGGRGEGDIKPYPMLAELGRSWLGGGAGAGGDQVAWTLGEAPLPLPLSLSLGMSMTGEEPLLPGKSAGLEQDVWQAVHARCWRDFSPCALLPSRARPGDDELARRAVWRGATIQEAAAAAAAAGGQDSGGAARAEGGAGRRAVCYGNLKVYSLFRLYQTMYDRLATAKALAAAQDAHKLSDMRMHGSAATERNASAAKVDSGAGATPPPLSPASAHMEHKEGGYAGDGAEGGDGAESEAGSSKEDADSCRAGEGGDGLEGADTYATFMALVHKLLAGQLDSADFEEHCRVLLGTSSFQVFTFEWLTEHLLRLARGLVGEDYDKEDGGAVFLALYEYQRLLKQRGGAGAASAHPHEDKLYEDNARSLAAPGDCYAFVFDPATHELSIAVDLLSPDDDAGAAERRGDLRRRAAPLVPDLLGQDADRGICRRGLRRCPHTRSADDEGMQSDASEQERRAALLRVRGEHECAVAGLIEWNELLFERRPLLKRDKEKGHPELRSQVGTTPMLQHKLDGASTPRSKLTKATTLPKAFGTDVLYRRAGARAKASYDGAGRAARMAQLLHERLDAAVLLQVLGGGQEEQQLDAAATAGSDSESDDGELEGGDGGAGVDGDGAGGEAGEGVEVAEGEGGGNLDWLLQATLGAEIEECAGAEDMRVDDEASLRGCVCLLSFCRLSVAVAVLVRLGLCLGSAL